MEGEKILAAIYRRNPETARMGRRFSFGSVASFAGGETEVDVNTTLPDGSTVNLKVPTALGYTPSPGHQVAIIYPTMSVHSGYAATPGAAAAIAPSTSTIPDGAITAAKLATDAVETLKIKDDNVTTDKLANPNAAFCISLHIGSVGAGVVVGTKQAATKNKTGKTLTVLGVTVFARSRTGTADPTVNVYEAAASILNAAVTLLADGTIYEPTVDDTSIANGAEISVRCTTDADGSISELDVHVWVKTEHTT